jgi:Domain of unknown function (DUF1772)
MNELWAISMLISGGLFAGGVMWIAWERIPAWQAMELPDFQSAFAHTLRRVDRLQPALLVACLVSTIGFALGTHGGARTMALAAGAGFLIVLVGSGAWLVPIQKRLVAADLQSTGPHADRLRRRWLRGHVVRAVVSLAALALAVVAVAL